MSQAQTAAPAPYRNPLGLPAGSVRALIAFLILAQFWLLLVVPELPGKAPVHVPLALYCLLGLVLHFFGSHGHSIGAVPGQPSPWHMPRGSIRLIMVLGSLAVIGYEYWFNNERMLARLTPPKDQLDNLPYFTAALGGGFCLGLVLRLGPWRSLAAFQDMLAWLSLLAILGLVVEVVLHVLISPTVGAPIDALIWECILIGVVSCYFGARS